MRISEWSSFTHLFELAHEYIERSKEVLIISPRPPDIDSLASCLMLSDYCAAYKKPHTLFCAGAIPSPEENSLTAFLPVWRFTRELPNPPADCILIPDYGDFHTSGIASDTFGPNAFFFGFDHHDHPADDFPKNGLQVIDTNAASTTALLWHFLRYNDVPFTRDIATYTALGIFTDTGRFTSSRMNLEAMEIMGYCSSAGFPWEKIRNAAEPSLTFSRIHAWQEAFTELEKNFDTETKLVSLVVGKERLRAWGGAKNALSVLGFMQMLKESSCAIIALEQEDSSWRLSIRSREPRLSAARLARSLIPHGGTGGGHKGMAGATWHDDPNTALSLIREAIRKTIRN